MSFLRGAHVRSSASSQALFANCLLRYRGGRPNHTAPSQVKTAQETEICSWRALSLSLAPGWQRDDLSMVAGILYLRGSAARFGNKGLSSRRRAYVPEYFGKVDQGGSAKSRIGEGVNFLFQRRGDPIIGRAR